MNAQMEANKKEHKWYLARMREFSANINVAPLTAKFYARHEQVDWSLMDNQMLDKLKRRHVRKPNDMDDEPKTTNQEYGWFITPFVSLDRCEEKAFLLKMLQSPVSTQCDVSKLCD